MSDLINSASLRLREIIMDALGVLVSEEAIPAVPLPSFNIEIPADKSHGDFAANTAMVCAKALKMPPRKIAELICEKLGLAFLVLLPLYARKRDQNVIFQCYLLNVLYIRLSMSCRRFR